MRELGNKEYIYIENKSTFVNQTNELEYEISALDKLNTSSGNNIHLHRAHLQRAQEIIASFEKLLSQSTFHELSKIIYSCAKYNLRPSERFIILWITRAEELKFSQCNQYDLTRILNAFSQLRLNDSAAQQRFCIDVLYTYIEKCANDNIDNMRAAASALKIINIFTNVYKLNSRDLFKDKKDLLIKFIAHYYQNLLSSKSVQGYDIAPYHQYLVFTNYCATLFKEFDITLKLLPRAIIDYMKSINDDHISKFEQKVKAHLLQKLGDSYKITYGQYIEHLHTWTDVHIEGDKVQMEVAVDGPSHYYFDYESNRLVTNGTTVLNSVLITQQSNLLLYRINFQLWQKKPEQIIDNILKLLNNQKSYVDTNLFSVLPVETIDLIEYSDQETDNLFLKEPSVSTYDVEAEKLKCSKYIAENKLYYIKPLISLYIMDKKDDLIIYLADEIGKKFLIQKASTELLEVLDLIVIQIAHNYFRYGHHGGTIKTIFSKIQPILFEHKYPISFLGHTHMLIHYFIPENEDNVYNIRLCNIIEWLKASGLGRENISAVNLSSLTGWAVNQRITDAAMDTVKSLPTAAETSISNIFVSWALRSWPTYLLLHTVMATLAKWPESIDPQAREKFREECNAVLEICKQLISIHPFSSIYVDQDGLTALSAPLFVLKGNFVEKDLNSLFTRVKTNGIRRKKDKIYELYQDTLRDLAEVERSIKDAADGAKKNVIAFLLQSEYGEGFKPNIGNPEKLLELGGKYIGRAYYRINDKMEEMTVAHYFVWRALMFKEKSIIENSLVTLKYILSHDKEIVNISKPGSKQTLLGYTCNLLSRNNVDVAIKILDYILPLFKFNYNMTSSITLTSFTRYPDQIAYYNPLNIILFKMLTTLINEQIDFSKVIQRLLDYNPIIDPFTTNLALQLFEKGKISQDVYDFIQQKQKDFTAPIQEAMNRITHKDPFYESNIKDEFSKSYLRFYKENTANNTWVNKIGSKKSIDSKEESKISNFDFR